MLGGAGGTPRPGGGVPLPPWRGARRAARGSPGGRGRRGGGRDSRVRERAGGGSEAGLRDRRRRRPPRGRRSASDAASLGGAGVEAVSGSCWHLVASPRIRTTQSLKMPKGSEAGEVGAAGEVPLAGAAMRRQVAAGGAGAEAASTSDSESETAGGGAELPPSGAAGGPAAARPGTGRAAGGAAVAELEDALGPAPGRDGGRRGAAEGWASGRVRRSAQKQQDLHAPTTPGRLLPTWPESMRAARRSAAAAVQNTGQLQHPADHAA